MAVDPEAPPSPCLISSLLGEIKILEVSIPPLDLPALSFPMELLEKMSNISDVLLDLANITLLMSMPGSTPPILSSPFPSVSSRSLIALPLILLLISHTVTVQLLVLTVAPPVPFLLTNVPEKVGIPMAQTALIFGLPLPTIIS